MTEKSRPDSKRWGGRNTIRSLCYRTGTSPQRERSSGWRLPCSIGASRDEKLPNGSKAGESVRESRAFVAAPFPRPLPIKCPRVVLAETTPSPRRGGCELQGGCTTRGGRAGQGAPAASRKCLWPTGIAGGNADGGAAHAGRACGHLGGSRPLRVLCTQGGPAAGHGSRGGRRPAGEAFGRQGVKGGWLRGIHWF